MQSKKFYIAEKSSRYRNRLRKKCFDVPKCKKVQGFKIFPHISYEKGVQAQLLEVNELTNLWLKQDWLAHQYDINNNKQHDSSCFHC